VTRSFRAAFLLIVLAAASARAEDVPQTQPVEKPLAAPAAVKSCVTMVNGRAWTGVVRVAGLWEKRLAGAEWTTCDKADPAAAIRLWYVAGREGFLSLPAAEVKNIENLGDLDEAALRALAAQAGAAEKQAKLERDRLRKERAAKPKPADKAGKPAEAPAPGASTGKAGTELLAKFPPPKWSAARRDEIEKRRLIQHVEPSAEEREFVENFGAWAKAMSEATAAPSPAEKPPAAAGPGK
jgi:hypothetical protein